jgi:hypothetical protein
MSNIPSFGDLTNIPDWVEWGDVPPEGTSPEVAELYGIYQTLTADKLLSAQDLQTLQTAVILMSSPKLSDPDPALLTEFSIFKQVTHHLREVPISPLAMHG